MENIQKLAQIYNMLCNISTKGNDTIIMSNCLVALHGIIESSQTMAQTEQKVGSGE